MEINYSQFAANAARLRERIAEACLRCGREPREVEWMAVTKSHSAEAVAFAARFGIRAVGENRVQEAYAKKKEVKVPIRWELIGHLQSNKAKRAVSLFDRIQSVENGKLIDLLDRICGEMKRDLPILLQVNAGNDPKKFGVPCEEAPGLLEKALLARRLKVEGFMTIAPWERDPGAAETAFNRLRDLRDRLSDEFSVALPELSMGMTGDLEEAITAGSTLIRVGTALFGPRGP